VAKAKIKQQRDKFLTEQVQKETSMDTELMLDVGQANELKLAFRRAGWSNAEIKKLCGGNLLAHLLPIVREYGETTMAMMQYIIDCDARPFERSGLTVAPESEQIPNRIRGQFVFDPTKVRLHLSPNQQGGKCIKGDNLKKELASEPVLPANVLDFVLANPHLIPEEWKKDENGNTRYIFFWGTIYRGSRGGLCVRYLCFHGGRWGWGDHWLDGDWRGSYPAALRASI
jgi:hypothetical protein